MRQVYLLISVLALSGCSTVNDLRTDLSANPIVIANTEEALKGDLASAFQLNGTNVIGFKRFPTEADIKHYMNAGFTLTDMYCDGFFRQTNQSFRKRKFGRNATNDVGTAITAILGLTGVGPNAIAGVATGVGFADSTWRNYDESFVVSPELDTVRSLVLAAQDQFRTETADKMPTDYMTARSAVIRYAGLCSFLGMQSLLNQSVDQQRRQLQNDAKPLTDPGRKGDDSTKNEALNRPDAAVGAVPPG